MFGTTTKPIQTNDDPEKDNTQYAASLVLAAPVNKNTKKIGISLTHNLHFQRPFSTVTLRILSHAHVHGLIGSPFHVLDDQSTIGEDTVFHVEGQFSTVPFPDDAVDGVAGEGAMDDQSTTGDDGVLVHWSHEGQTIDTDAC